MKAAIFVSLGEGAAESHAFCQPCSDHDVGAGENQRWCPPSRGFPFSCGHREEHLRVWGHDASWSHERHVPVPHRWGCGCCFSAEAPHFSSSKSCQVISMHLSCTAMKWCHHIGVYLWISMLPITYSTANILGIQRKLFKQSSCS